MSAKLARRLWRSNAGGAAIQMAFVAPVLFFCIFGTFELGWAVYCGATVRSAVIHGARALINDPTTTAAAIQTDAQSRLYGVPVNDLNVTLDTETIGSGQVAHVAWTYSYNSMLPFVPHDTFHFNSSTLVPIGS